MPLDEPVPVPCAACGRRPSHRREFRGDRHLCRACHGAAVRREQRAGPPLPGTIDTEVLVPVTAPVGRCDVCGLEAAAFAGGGVRLCAACYDRETRREMREGGGAPAGHERRPGPGDPPSPRSLGRPPALQRPPGE